MSFCAERKLIANERVDFGMYKKMSRIPMNEKDEKGQTRRTILIEDESAFISDADSIFPRHRSMVWLDHYTPAL